MAANPLVILMLGLGAIVAFVLFIIFVMVPIFRGIGSLITGLFRTIGWIVSHIAEFIGGMISDVVRLVGSILALLVLGVLVPANVIIGRWSAAGHYSSALKRELAVAGGCLYRFLLRRPLKLFWLHGLLEGLEERVPEAMHAAPTSDVPSKRTGQFDGYTIVGSLRGGGSGGKLYVARPDDARRSKLTGHPELVVIKAFAITEGSSLPQIVRESRALECAKHLGHVLEHGMDEHRFYYVMPYHAGDHLGIIARQLHAESDGKGLSRARLSEVCGYMRDVLATLRVYHDGGFWHKDIKPENIIVHDGRAHVVDLGLITRLKSAMTLTTHGTEYFRDPEMVRQALRGVKVHQVNGVKFDIYAAGAVLYFVLENTFPAHGGLSRFTRNSPEALRWIVKRAMAEYNQRYETAEMMLADLEVVTSADDPFAVKLSALPSMRAAENAHEELDIEIETESPQARQVAAAGSPWPPKGGPDHIGSNAGEKEARMDDPVVAGPPRRPRLRVLDWFTGRYAVDDPGSAAAGVGSAGMAGFSAHPRRAHAPDRSRDDWKRQKKQFKEEIKQFKRDVKNHAETMRRSARDQLRSAQSRVQTMQQRVAKRRHAVGVERQPSPAVTVTSILLLAAIFLAIWFWPSETARQQLPIVREWVNNSHSTTSVASSTASLSPHSGGRPVLVVMDVEPDRRNAVKQHDDYRALIEQHTQDGYQVLVDIGPDTDDVRQLIRQWRDEPTGAAGEAMESILAEHDLYGFLVIRAATTDGGKIERLGGSIIQSNHPAAKERRWPHIPPDAIGEPPERPFLLVNDHPTRTDPRVADRVQHQLAMYESRGWRILTDDDAEVAVRKVLPTGGAVSLTSAETMPQRLQAVLHERNLGGILLITAPPGEAPSHERIAVIEIAIE